MAKKKDNGTNGKETNGKEETTTEIAERPEVLTPDVSRGLFDLKKNLEGVKPRLPLIAILHGETQLYKMPDGTKVDSFEGVILDVMNTNAWWSIPFEKSGGGTPPDCYSMDAITPDMNAEDVQAESCHEKKCAQNVFGSDPKGGRGKACKNMKRVHILIEGQQFPHRLVLPPSNLDVADNYVSILTSKGTPYQLVITKFSLKQTSSKEGIKYSRVVMEEAKAITTVTEAQAIKRAWSDWRPIMREQPIDSEEYSE